jgi:hypothetical protein
LYFYKPILRNFPTGCDALYKKHLALCQIGVATPDREGFKQINKQNAKATGIKTIKAKYQNAKFVNVADDVNGICIEPTVKATRGFTYVGGNLLCDKSCTDEILGMAIREGLNKCE